MDDHEASDVIRAIEIEFGFIGESGVMLLPHVGMPSLYPESQFANYAMPEVAGTSHWHDWVDAVLEGKKTTDGFDFAGPVSEAVQLGNIAAKLPGQSFSMESFSAFH